MNKRKLKTIICDDSAVLRGIFEKELKDSQNIEIVALVSNGRKAVDYCRDNPVDLLITDYDMPEMNGLETLKLVTKEFRLPVCVYSDDNSIKNQIMKEGALLFAVKPPLSEYGSSAMRDFINQIEAIAKNIKPGPDLKISKGSKRSGITGYEILCIGASTGGFTDCMLQNGAAKVYSVDVGYGQLDWKLRNDERVVNLERTNVRYITREQVPDEIDFFSVDVCFISLTLVLPAVRPLIKENGEAVCLIKPQFEAGRGKVGKNGVVRDKNIHIDVIRKIYEYCLSNGFDVVGLDFSPIKGPEGNIEYLIYIRRSDEPKALKEFDIEELAELSHKALDK